MTLAISSSDVACDAGNELGAPYQTVGGLQRLGVTATATQVLELLSVARSSAKARGVSQPTAKICGQTVQLHQLYNSMQKQGGFSSVSAP